MSRTTTGSRRIVTIETDDSENAGTLERSVRDLRIALPPPNDRLDQDEEWVVVEHDGAWERVRLHDYPRVFSIPGLYERWVYEVFRCTSPAKVRDMLGRVWLREGVVPADMTVLDLGAGNGCVAEALRDIGIERFVGLDIFDEARAAAMRDRPGLYTDYVVGDMTDMHADGSQTLGQHEFGCMVCVAALGFGDIPPAVFAAAFNLVEEGGWIGFTIKQDMLEDKNPSGFARLVNRMIEAGAVEIREREAYVHRVTADGQELMYEAIIARKRAQFAVS